MQIFEIDSVRTNEVSTPKKTPDPYESNMRAQTLAATLSWAFFLAALLLPILSTYAAAYRWNLPLGLNDFNRRGESGDVDAAEDYLAEEYVDFGRGGNDDKARCGPRR